MNIASTSEAYYLAYKFAAALGIGLLIGAERERRKGEGHSRSPGGYSGVHDCSSGRRSELGGGGRATTGGHLSGSGRPVCRRIYADRRALLLTVLLGSFALKDPVMASGLAVTVAIALMAQPDSSLLRDVLSEEELNDALIFAAAALLVPPLVPDRYVGPFSAINARTIWKIVILIMSISAAGHIAVRLLGSRLELPVAGLASGFVSSVATIAAMGARARNDPQVSRPAVAEPCSPPSPL